MISLVQGSTVVQDAERSLRHGAVAFDGERIEAVGPFDELRARWPEAPLLGGSDKVVIPGLANAHDHGRGVNTWDRGLTDGPLESWRMESQLVGWPGTYWQALYYGTLMLRSGVTTLVHMHLTGQPVGGLLESAAPALRAYRELGLRVCFAIGVWDQNRLVYGDDEAFLAGLPAELGSKARARWGPPVGLDETVAVARELIAEARGSRVQVYLGPLGTQWTSEALLKGLKRAADDLETGIHTHLLETPYQKMWADRTFGRPLVEVLDEWGIVDERFTGAHAVWLTDGEMEVLARRGAAVSHNPSSNLRLSNGVARVPKLLEHGVAVGIGLDGMGFREQDLFAEMRMALALGRPPGLETPKLDARTVWSLATQGGTRAALGRDDLGVLEPGRIADLVVLDGATLAEPFTAIERDPVDLVIWRGRPELVETVVIGGETVFEHGQPATANPAGAAQQLNAELAALEAGRQVEPWHAELLEYARRFYAGWGPLPAREWAMIEGQGR